MTKDIGFPGGLQVKTMHQDALEAGARNLLINCAECKPGERLLIVFETENDGYYDAALARTIASVARRMGLSVDTFGVPLLHDVRDPGAALAARMDAVQCTIFLARLGDQIRFRTARSSMRQVISYALDCETLASPFGTIAYQAFEKLSAAINVAIAKARKIHVTCPAGTDFHGNPAAFAAGSCDTTRKRFPVSVFAPVPATGFQGRIAQNGFLTGTGSHFYSPSSCEVRDTLIVNFEESKITGFDGSHRDVEAARRHYEFVGNKYGIDTFHVHSWHAGIHPGCAYHAPAGQFFERWSGSAFGNPRLLHFHTCGDYPPGEISLNVLDPTVWIDGVAVWEDGRLYPERIAGGAALLAQYPEMQAVFDNPMPQVGQAESGYLAFA